RKLFQPQQICAVTFTNRAAEEITTRLRSAVGLAAEEITRGTLHALCLGILREQGESVGLPRGFGVADDAYQHVVLARFRLPPKWRGSVLTRFSSYRFGNRPLQPDDERLFQRYSAYLRSQGLIDFDEIILYTAQLFERAPAVADAVASRWAYLLVDEFQDLNPAQYGILQRLAARHQNFFAVGDDEQSIFSWTGADPAILFRFQQDYGVVPIILDQNRRSSRQIFETARRILGGNTSLFEKRLRAERTSEHEVRACAFGDEDQEAEWLVADLTGDRARSGLEWGDYGILYRRHEVGRHLETALVRAGVPCRLARGRALTDDDVIGYIVASLRVIASPGDSAALEVAARPLPEDLREEVRAIGEEAGLDFLGAMREFARRRGWGSPEAKKAWRFIRYVENLTALARTQTTLRGLVEELLSQRVSRFGNRLEERADELSDPADLPDVRALADRLDATQGRGIWFAPAGGVDIALRRMLLAARLVPAERAEGARLCLGPTDGGSLGLPLALFKALQLRHSRDFRDGFRQYVAFDLETTDRDVAACEIVEIGAVRVKNGVVTDRFRSLVRPVRPVSTGATQVHGYQASDLDSAPAFKDVWPDFRAFVGQDVLMAHNGQKFDVPVLQRMAGGMSGLQSLVFFDTLPLARSLYRASRRLSDLAQRFGLDVKRSHHALDDAETLALVFGELSRRRLIRARKASLANLLDWLGVALALDQPLRTGEHEVVLDIARVYALGRYSDCLEVYAADRESGERDDAPSVEELIERLGGEKRRKQIRAEKSVAERYAEALARLDRLLAASEGPSLDDSIRRFLEQVALSKSAGEEADRHRVNLLTLHATKGLEFSRVYVVGVEDASLPGLRELEGNRVHDIQEARRLLYVGMTRAEDRLVLTRAERRGGWPTGGAAFLEEMGLAAIRAVPPTPPPPRR
ncbi:MAG: UvrD-helicase domain-containing protein, partial [Gemmatimonadetes bacterium]|nr:UvrD-helicase domain-containing protein [Gemmatimonadota bacterium]